MLRKNKRACVHLQCQYKSAKEGLFMPRKAKKKVHKMPPLSFVDQVVYWTIMMLLCVMWCSLIVCHFRLRDMIAFADEAVIAAVSNISELWFIIPCSTFFSNNIHSLGNVLSRTKTNIWEKKF